MFLQFVRFMFFSGTEFLALLILMFSIFSLEIRTHIKKILLIGAVMTSISYILCINELYGYLMIVQFPTYVTLIKFMFGQRWLYSTWISAVGFVSYLAVQTVSAYAALYFGYMTQEELVLAFTFKGEILQGAMVIVVLIISAYIKITKQGYILTLKDVKTQKANYIIISVFTVIFLSFCYLMFEDYLLSTYLNYFAILLTLSLLFLIHVSNIRNNSEVKDNALTINKLSRRKG